MTAQLSVPKWLNECFFIDIFEKQFGLCKQEFKIVIKSVELSGGGGENYTSNLFKVNVEAVCDNEDENRSLSLFVKAMISSLEGLGVFQSEIASYLLVLPALEEIWKSVGISVKFGPNCYKVYSTDTDEVMVLDDLTSKKYAVADRFKGLDLDHSMIFLKKLAQFHAASATHLKKCPKIIQ